MNKIYMFAILGLIVGFLVSFLIFSGGATTGNAKMVTEKTSDFISSINTQKDGSILVEFNLNMCLASNGNCANKVKFINTQVFSEFIGDMSTIDSPLTKKQRNSMVGCRCMGWENGVMTVGALCGSAPNCYQSNICSTNLGCDEIIYSPL